MTLAEFKAWFEGYTDGIGGMPNEGQWEHIKMMVGRLGLPQNGAVSSNTVVSPYHGFQAVNPSLGNAITSLAGKKPA